MKTRAIFLVHGVGSQEKGQSMEAVLEPLLKFLQTSFPDVGVHVDLRPREGPATATIEFQDERWEVTEVWWADAFFPQAAQRVLRWGFRVLLLNAGNFVCGMIPLLRRNPWHPCEDPVYRRNAIPRTSRPYDLLTGLVSFVLLVFGYLPVLLLASVFYVLALLPSWLVFPNWLRNLVVKLTSALVAGPGDQYALMYTVTAASTIRQQVIAALRPYVDGSDPDRRKCDKAAFITHSGGATAAFSVISDRRLWRDWSGSPEPPVDMVFFTVGSSLTVSHENVPEHPMWDDPLPERIDWIDLWSRYDWAPHGPPSTELARKVRGDEGRFCTVRVVNLDSVFSDHGAYWANHEEVVSRFVYEITGRPSRGTEGHQQSCSESEDEIRKAVDAAITRIPGHRKRIGKVNLARTVVIAALAVAAGLFPSVMQTAGAWVLDNLTTLETWPRPLEILVGILLFVLAITSLWRLVRLWFGALLYKDPWGRIVGIRSSTRGSPGS